MEIQTTIATDTTITIKTKDRTAVAISKTTDTTPIAKHQTSKEMEKTQTNNHADTVTEVINRSWIVKPVLIAENWDTCLANLEHHGKIQTIGYKIRMLTRTREITTKTATQLLLSIKTTKLDQSTFRSHHVDDTNEGPITQLLDSVVDHRRLYVQISILNK